MPAMNRRKNEIIGEFADYRRGQLESDRFTLFRNRAKFVDPRTVELDDGRKLTADRFMIATGSEVAVPPVPGLSGVPFWTSDDVLELDFIPVKAIVLGGGVVACELAQFMRRIGSEGVQVQRSPHILSGHPPEAADVVADALCEEGIDLYTGTEIHGVQYDGKTFRVIFDHDGKRLEVSAPHLLNALGRRPASDGLGLEAAGVDTTDGGHIACDAMQRTSNPRIRACGDVAGPHEIVHLAVMQGELAARDATGRPAVPIDYDTLTTVVFTDPQLATAGRTAASLKREGVDCLTASFPFADHGKSILMNAPRGHVRVSCDPRGRVLGAECVAKDAGELIHAMAVAVALKADARDLLKAHWYHPTLSEIWTHPLGELAGRL